MRHLGRGIKYLIANNFVATIPKTPFWVSYVPLESGRNVFAQPPLPRTAMEQSGHAQVPTLLVALVRRQAGRAGWTAEIGCKNREE